MKRTVAGRITTTVIHYEVGSKFPNNRTCRSLCVPCSVPCGSAFASCAYIDMIAYAHTHGVSVFVNYAAPSFRARARAPMYEQQARSCTAIRCKSGRNVAAPPSQQTSPLYKQICDINDARACSARRRDIAADWGREPDRHIISAVAHKHTQHTRTHHCPRG